jgi:RNA polymerase sigma-70 factor (ECF subfamily)
VPIATGIDRNGSKSAGIYHTEERALALDEESLVSKARSGDDKAFCELIKPYLNHIYRTAARITRNHEDAEDVSQECLVKAFTHMQAFRKDAKFSTWLTRIAINESLMRVRKRKPELRFVLDDKDLSEVPSVSQIRDHRNTSDPEAIWAQKERNDLLREAVHQLGENSKIAIHLFEAGEMKMQEIGNALRLSQSGVKTRLRRALRNLRSILGERLGGREGQVRGWI